MSSTASEAQFELEQERFFGDESIYLDDTIDLLQRERIRARLGIVRRFLNGGRVLEVGPGAGNFAKALIENGFDVEAVEHSAPLGDAISQKLGMDVRIGEFEQLEFSSGSYDGFVSCHVIEHVRDLFAHLDHAAGLTRIGGVAFIATPNAQSWEHRFLGRRSPNYSTAHVRLFTGTSLSIAMRRCGWEAVAQVTPSYTESYLRVLTAILRAIRGQGAAKPRGGYAAAASNRGGQILLGAASILSWPLRALQTLAGRGNELFIVARRVDSSNDE